MIKFHPDISTLTSFARGTLPPAISFIVSVHCDMCVACCDKTRSLTEATADVVFSVDTPDDVVMRDYISMFECITRDTSRVDAELFNDKSRSIDLDGRSFSVPATLARLSGRVGEWSHLVGKLWQAPIDIGGGSLVQLIYMEKGGCVPEHTHKGSEISLVLDGQFDDGKGHYASGDYVSFNQTDTHMPVAKFDEGCLVITILDKPLHFTTGWAKLINPLSQLYFKVNTN